MEERCLHKFSVEKIFPGEPLAQILFCKMCDKKFFGFGGTAGHPQLIRELRDNGINEKQLKDVLYTSIDLKI